MNAYACIGMGYYDSKYIYFPAENQLWNAKTIFKIAKKLIESMTKCLRRKLARR